MLPFNTDKLRSFMFRRFPTLESWPLVRRSITATGLILILYIVLGEISLVSLFDLHWSPNLSSYNPFEYKLDQLLSRGFIGVGLGFFAVELLSFVIPPFKHYRNGGPEGRRQLILWSLGTSLLLIIYFSYNQLSVFNLVVDSSGKPVLPDDALWQKALVMIVFVVIGILACVMAEGITRFGIGNGFCVLIGYDFITGIPSAIHDLFTPNGSVLEPLGRKNIMTGEPPNLVGYLLFIFLLMVLYKKFWNGVPFLEFCKNFRRYIPDLYKKIQPVVLKTQAKGKPVDFQLPYFPQGVFPLLWPESILMYFATLLFSLDRSTTPFSEFTSWTYWLLYSVLLAGTSFLSYWLISHPMRIAHNIPVEITFQEGWLNQVQQNATRSITVITLVWFLWNAPLAVNLKESLLYGSLGLAGITSFAAISKDLVDQFRFMNSAENPQVLETFDNVHFVTYLKGLFEAEGIRFCIQAFEYRRLFYFFEPLIKMRVLIDARDWKKAKELADLENVTII